MHEIPKKKKKVDSAEFYQNECSSENPKTSDDHQKMHSVTTSSPNLKNQSFVALSKRNSTKLLEGKTLDFLDNVTESGL